MLFQNLNKHNFFNSGIPSLIRWEDSIEQNLSLTLNSDVLFYSPNRNGFSLREFYTIKKESAMSREVGTWNLANGLVIPEPNIWERRANFGRVLMKIGVMGSTFLMRVNTTKET